jgi:hypothetical protein
MEDPKNLASMEPSIASQDTKTEAEDTNIRDVEKGRLNENGAIQADEAGETKAADPNIVDWDGPDDPANPMNWASRKKTTAIGIVSAITFLSYVHIWNCFFLHLSN